MRKARNPKGRPKGVPNKFTTNMRQAIEAAFQGLGGVQWLIDESRKDPRLMVTLIARMLPLQATIQVNPGWKAELDEARKRVIEAEAVAVIEGDGDGEGRHAGQAGDG